MKLKSAAGIVCYVKSVLRTVRFYEALGVSFKKKTPRGATGYINWFWIELLKNSVVERPGHRRRASVPMRGAGQFLCLNVENVDAAFKGLKRRGLKPLSDPVDRPSGIREFLIRDPDGFHIMIFSRVR
jgi:catechol 2,3-dioxygenase-like lactoylglutathione lyase family enzyme